MSDFDVVVVGASVAGYDVWRKFEAIGSRRRSPVTLFAPRTLAHVARATSQSCSKWARFWSWAGPLFGIAWVLSPTLNFFFDDPAAWQVVLVVPLILGFSALFLHVVMTQRPVAAPVLGMLAISVLLTLVASDVFAFLFIWPASAASVRLSGLTSAKVLCAITALAAGTIALTDPDGALFWGVTSLVFGTGALWLLIGGLLRTNAALREARAELAEMAVAEERLRFARDLHDILGHDLSLIALKAELAGKLLPDRTERAATEVGEIRELTRSALAQVREAVDGYRRPSLGSVLAWAVREGATNAIRHSGARHAEIVVRDGTLEIADDGRGAPAARPGGNGLTGLRERVQSVGGTVEAGAGPAGGFRLTVRVPAA